MATKDEIIQELINKKFIEKLCTTFSGQLGGNKDDFYGEMWMIILTEISEEKLVKLYHDKTLYFYLLSIARNQVVNDKSTFNRMYNRKINTIPIEDYITEQDEDNEGI